MLDQHHMYVQETLKDQYASDLHRAVSEPGLIEIALRSILRLTGRGMVAAGEELQRSNAQAADSQVQQHVVQS